MATVRPEYQSAVAAVVLIPVTYVVLIVFGTDSGVAAMWAPGFAAPLSLIALAGYARASATHPILHHVDQWRLLMRAAALLVLVLLVESTLSGLIAGYAPVAAADGPRGHPVQLRNALDTMLSLPVGMLMTFGLGVWSSRQLAVSRPAVWLAVIAVCSRVVRLLLYWPVAAFSRPRSIAVHGFEHTLIRNTVLGVLIFCLLALGNRYGHRRATKSASDGRSVDV